MEIKIDSNQIKELVGEAILNSFSQEQKNILVQEAIKGLLKKSNDRYDSKSELEKAFQYGVEQMARSMVREHLENDPTAKEQIRSVFVEAFEKVFKERREVTVTRVADALQKSFDFKDGY